MDLHFYKDIKNRATYCKIHVARPVLAYVRTVKILSCHKKLFKQEVFKHLANIQKIKHTPFQTLWYNIMGEFWRRTGLKSKST